MTQTGKQTKREEGRCGQRNGVDTRKDKVKRAWRKGKGERMKRGMRKRKVKKKNAKKNRRKRLQKRLVMTDTRKEQTKEGMNAKEGKKEDVVEVS